MAAPATNPLSTVDRLGAVCRARGPHGVASRLHDLHEWLADDLAAIEAELALLPRGGSLAQRGARHQLDLGGKLLRPMCVALASRFGSGFSGEARQMAVAVELIHNATLLHDDVIDLADQRRGSPAARTIYGNAASILAGDWLLVEALKRIRRHGSARLLERALDTIERMVAAEALQLENRGRLNLSHADYFRVVDGKTAALFRWGMAAGAIAGGLADDQRVALERYGVRLGAAFQLADDLLDVTGDPARTGKPAFADLREGKMTYPLLLALERDPSLWRLVERLLRRPAEAPLSGALCARVQESLIKTGGIRDCLALARRRADKAVACLAPLPAGPGRDALAMIASTAVRRDR